MNWNGEVLFNAAEHARLIERALKNERGPDAPDTNRPFTISGRFNRQQMIKHVR
jgi:hypothetical protein